MKQGLAPVSLSEKTVEAELDEAWEGWPSRQQVLLDWGLSFVALAEPVSGYDLSNGLTMASKISQLTLALGY